MDAAKAAVDDAVARAVAIPKEAAGAAKTQVEQLVAEVKRAPEEAVEKLAEVPETLKKRAVNKGNKIVGNAQTRLAEEKLRLAQTRLEIAKEKKRKGM